jgi:hypothetical protein
MSSLSQTPRLPAPAFALRLPEACFYFVTGATLIAWALSLVADLAPKLSSGQNLQTVLLRNAGTSTLILALTTLSVIGFLGTINTLRARSFPSPTASILLITICALRALQILTEGSVTVADANMLGGIFFAATLLYFSTPRLWWLVLMPLATIAAFSPLVWLEFLKGAPNAILLSSLIVPGFAFVSGSLLIVIRELRFRSNANVSKVWALRTRGESTMASLRAMESDLKSLRAILSGDRMDLGPLETTEFNVAPAQVEPSETCSFLEVDTAARRLLDEARSAVEGRPVKLSLTVPSGAGLPVAMRGSAPVVTAWMKTAILNSIESLGGFPDGMVRVSIRPSLTSLVISIEDNGRGFGESLLTKMGQTDERLSLAEIRAGVERLSGRFDIQARLGVGSRLSIELPRIDAFATSPRAAAASRVAMLQSAALSPESLHSSESRL